jgi:DNA-binding NarL/FixJ family response regulator
MNTTPRLPALTPRERDLVRCIVAGKTNREIARALHVSEQVMKNMLRAIYQKCHVRNSLELALFTVRHHLLADEGVRRENREKRYG